MYFEALYQEFDFGKFKGCDLGEVLMCSPEYVKWVIENVDGGICAFSDGVIDQIRTIFPSLILTEKILSQIKVRQYEHEEKIYYEKYAREDTAKGQFDECYDEDTYERFNGSYAQDEMGYSDEDIDTIFDGDPSAYWNID